MTELYHALAMSAIVTHEGKQYQIAPITAEVMARWEDFLATETLSRLRRLLAKEPNGLEMAIRTVADQSAAGTFDFDSETSAKRMREVDGIKHLTFFRIQSAHPDVAKTTTDAIVDRSLEDFLVQMRAAQETMERLSPNVEAPSTGANASNSDGEPCSPKSATSSTCSPPTSESAA